MGFPQGHRTATTLVAGLRLDGMVTPPAIVLGPMADNGSLLDGSRQRRLVRSPCCPGAGAEAAPRQCRGHGQALQPPAGLGRRGSRGEGRTGHLLPPYSPDFNPIEIAFAKLKALLRKAAEWTVDAD
jgi:hypothetical protein